MHMLNYRYSFLPLFRKVTFPLSVALVFANILCTIKGLVTQCWQIFLSNVCHLKIGFLKGILFYNSCGAQIYQVQVL